MAQFILYVHKGGLNPYHFILHSNHKIRPDVGLMRGQRSSGVSRMTHCIWIGFKLACDGKSLDHGFPINLGSSS